MTVEESLKRVLRSTESDCWLWAGAVNNKGYGQIGVDGKTRSTHRVAYEVAHGPIPEGTQIDHTCHNADTTCPGGTSCVHRRCINPAHLEAVTQGENERRASRDKCPNGHDYTPENTAQRRDNGRRICLTCQRATAQRRNVGYGKPGRPSKAAQAALAAERLADTG